MMCVMVVFDTLRVNACLQSIGQFAFFFAELGSGHFEMNLAILRPPNGDSWSFWLFWGGLLLVLQGLRWSLENANGNL